MIDIHVLHKLIRLSAVEQSLAAGIKQRSRFLDEFKNCIEAKASVFVPSCVLTVGESVIKRMVTKYSEQIIYQPLNEILFWFTYKSGAYIEPGYPPLFYLSAKDRISPNKSAVAGIGEAVAGLIAQRVFKCKKLARPNHDRPDIVMDAGALTMLVESKATIDTDSHGIMRTIENEVADMAALLFSCSGLDVRPLKALLVGTKIESQTKYESFVVEITTI